MQRRLLLKPDIGREYFALCSSQLPFTDLLFGDDLQKHLKDIGDQTKLVPKLPQLIKAHARMQGSLASSVTNSQKNWKGPSQRPWKHKGQGNRDNKSPHSSQ